MDATAQLVSRIIAQGPDDKARARVLRVSTRTITEYKAGKMPRIVKNLLDLGILKVCEGTADDTTEGGEAGFTRS